MSLITKPEVDIDCVEKGHMWSDYILHCSSGLLIRKMEVTHILVSFDVLISLIHHSTYQAQNGECSRLFQDNGTPAEISTFTHSEKYYFYTHHEKVDVIVDFLAHPETIELV